uniref:G protein-coupled receptor n=1 Tax=Romanomermis culicivorax TaxID=13658 RepID=A0A915JH24_ROMCU
MNAANIYIGSMLILVSTVILSINTYILLLIGRNYRFATFKNPTSSSGVNGQRNQPKGPYILHHLPTCYFLSLSACFALRLLLTVVHNGPTLIMDDLFAGASVSGLAGWLYKCSYYGAIGHVIVLCIHKYTLLSGYKKRQRRNKGKRHVIFGSSLLIYN